MAAGAGLGPEKLILAAKQGSVELCRAWLTLGVDVSAVDAEGNTALRAASLKGHVKVVEVLLAARADLKNTDDQGITALHSAAMMGHVEVVETLLAAGADIKSTDGQGMTPLHDAANFGKTKVVNVLLAAGADVNALDDEGWTPLALAAQHGDAEVIQALLAAGAKQFSNKAGETPLHIVLAEDVPSELKQRALKLLVSTYEKLTKKYAVIEKYNTLGRLYKAAATGESESVQMFVNMIGRILQTELDNAIYLGDAKSAIKLLAAGANAHVVDSRGATQLHKAVTPHLYPEGYAPKADRRGVAKALKAVGVSVDAKNSLGRTPYDVAQRNAVLFASAASRAAEPEDAADPCVVSAGRANTWERMMPMLAPSSAEPSVIDDGAAAGCGGDPC